MAAEPPSLRRRLGLSINQAFGSKGWGTRKAP